MAKILFYDIETSPMIMAGFEIWNTNIPTSGIMKDWTIFSAAWGWLGEDEIHSASTATMSEKQVVKKLVNAINSADIIVAHNGDKFDIKKLRTRVIMLDLPVLSNVVAIDTLKVVKKHFKFTSNRLDYVAKALGMEGKSSTSEGLWMRALVGDKAALKEMEEYNRQDIVVLKNLYLKLRPYIDNHPSVARLNNTHISGGCQACGSISVHRHDKQISKKHLYARYRCQECGHVFKGEILKEIGNG